MILASLATLAMAGPPVGSPPTDLTPVNAAIRAVQRPPVRDTISAQPVSPALNPAPVISMGTTTPTGTLVLPVAGSGASSTVSRAKFTLSGGANYVVPSTTYPFYTGVSLQQAAVATAGFGNAYVDFFDDDPLVTFIHYRSNSASTRILVDGVEVLRISGGVTSGTAQAGGANTITLAASANASNGWYANYWVHLISGTGAGQYGQITSYVGSTKVATIQANWATAPDSTSVYEITDTKAAYTNLTNTGASVYFPALSWGGERRVRHYRVEHSGQPFYGVYNSSAISTVLPAPKPYTYPSVTAGDSFSAGAGQDMGNLGSMTRVRADIEGYEDINLSIGGTGLLNANSGLNKSLKLGDRLLPPANAWFAQWNGASAGSFVLTQGGVSVTLGYSDASTTMQTAFDAAFGANAFQVVTIQAGTQRNLFVVGQGTTAALTSAMTADFSGLTGATAPALSRWAGDLEGRLYRDGSGIPIPFDLTIAMCHNDTVSSGFATAALTAEATRVESGLVAKYPMARITYLGCMYLPGGSGGSDVATANAALASVAAAVLPKTPFGVTPYIDTVTTPWFSGSGSLGLLAGSGNSDLATYSDHVHPTALGATIYGIRSAAEKQRLWSGGPTSMLEPRDLPPAANDNTVLAMAA